MGVTYQLIVWADPGQEALLRECTLCDGLVITSIGSSVPEAAADYAKQLGAERFGDLRHALSEYDADAVWLVGVMEVDPDVMRLIADRDICAFTTHPQPSSLSEFLASPEEIIAAMRFVPLMRRSPGFRAANECIADFGEISAVSVSFRSGPAHGSVFARLFDAMDVVNHLCGSVDVLDAALAGAGVTGGFVPETLGELCGHMTINLRFPENRCACVAVSDGAGSWFRGVTLLGESGCIRISDGDFQWIDPAGRVVDSYSHEHTLTPGELTAMQIERSLAKLDTGEAPQTPEHIARLLAVCESARLSCRTGHGEAPRKLLEMRSRP